MELDTRGSEDKNWQASLRYAKIELHFLYQFKLSFWNLIIGIDLELGYWNLEFRRELGVWNLEFRNLACKEKLKNTKQR